MQEIFIYIHIDVYGIVFLLICRLGTKSGEAIYSCFFDTDVLVELWHHQTSTCSLTQVWQDALAPTWNCEWHAAGWCELPFTLICSSDDGQHAHTLVSTGRNVPGIGHTRHKWSTVPKEYVTVGFIHSCCQRSISAIFFSSAKKKKEKRETSAPLAPFRCCKHSSAFLHIF